MGPSCKLEPAWASAHHKEIGRKKRSGATYLEEIEYKLI